MNEHKFKIGDRVKIRKNSIYSNQSQLIGLIIDIKKDDEWFRVDFPDYTNAYRDEDLEFAESNLKQEIINLKELILSDKYTIELNKDDREIFYKILDKLDIIVDTIYVNDAVRFKILYHRYNNLSKKIELTLSVPLTCEVIKFKDIQDKFRKLKDEKI